MSHMAYLCDCGHDSEKPETCVYDEGKLCACGDRTTNPGGVCFTCKELEIIRRQRQGA